MIFGYNGHDGVVTDKNGLIYMRARYYSPELRRFVNADVVPGEIPTLVEQTEHVDFEEEQTFGTYLKRAIGNLLC